VGAAGDSVEVVAGHDLVLDSFIVVLQAVLGVVALELVEVADRELVLLRPAELEPLFVGDVGLLGLGGVQQVEDLLVVDL